jgi:hypothetical protein
MTIYVVFKAVRAGQLTMETPVTMSVTAAREPASKMYFKPGERFPLDSALKYLMVKSANDVAVAIAEAVSGTEEAFVQDMNAAARQLGMTSLGSSIRTDCLVKASTRPSATWRFWRLPCGGNFPSMPTTLPMKASRMAARPTQTTIC